MTRTMTIDDNDRRGTLPILMTARAKSAVVFSAILLSYRFAQMYLCLATFMPNCSYSNFDNFSCKNVQYVLKRSADLINLQVVREVK